MTTPQPQPDVACAPDIRTASDARQFVSHVIRNDLGDGVFDAGDVLNHWPVLAPYESAVLDLVYEEYVRRAAAGEEIDPHEFAARYPELHSVVLEHIQAHELLEKCFDGAPIWPREGETFHGFEILSEIGRGAFSRVYVARETEIGSRLVVIKVCLSRTHEAHLLGQLEHPAIVGVHSVIQDPARQLHALVMPYLGRVTLQHLIDDCRRTENVATAEGVLQTVQRLNDATPNTTGRASGSYEQCVMRLMLDVASALEFAHARGVLHSDVKPSNVLVTPELRAKLLDFNLSQESGERAAVVGGTLPYMSPEQLIAVMADQQPASTIASDVHAFGLTLYEALTGLRPYGNIPPNLNRHDLAAWLLAHHNTAIDPARIKNRGLRSLIQRCIATANSDRPATMAAVASQLDKERRAVVRAWRRCEANPKRAAGIAAVGLLVFAAAIAGAYNYPWHEHHMQAARNAFRGDDWPSSIDHAERVLRSPRAADNPPLLAEAHWYAAWSLAAMDDFNGAVEHLTLADNLTPADPEVLAARAYCMARSERYIEAVELFQAAKAEFLKAEQSGLALPTVIFDLAQCQILSGQFGQAAATLNEGFLFGPDDPNLLVARSMVECIKTNQFAVVQTQRRQPNVTRQQAVQAAVEGFNGEYIARASANGASGLYFEVTAARSQTWLAAQDKNGEHLKTASEHWKNAVELGASATMFENLRQDYELSTGSGIDAVMFPAANAPSSPPLLIEPVTPIDGP